MLFRHLLWDFDGTICDTMPSVVRAFGDALGDFGVSAPQTLVESLVMQSLSRCADTLAGQHNLDSAALLESFQQRYRQIPVGEQPLFPGVVAVLDAVQAAGGHNLLFSHRGRESLARFLGAHAITGFFTEFLTVDDGYPAKPDPGGLLALISKYHLPFQQVLAVGDRAIDILAGQAAGVRTCYFGGEPPEHVRPDYAVTSYEALYDILFSPE